jgi:nucleotide-binding universal stress UspA family protein
MTIVVGYVNTPEGEAALQRAIEEADLRNARLEVVHSRKEGEQRDVADIRLYDELLAGIGARLQEAGIEHGIHDFIRGNTPAEDLIDSAERFEAELVVIGIRSRTRTGKYLLGSTAQDLLLQAKCAVLAVKRIDNIG